MFLTDLGEFIRLDDNQPLIYLRRHLVNKMYLNTLPQEELLITQMTCF